MFAGLHLVSLSRAGRWAALALALAAPGSGLPGLPGGGSRPRAPGALRVIPPDYRAPGRLPPIVFVSRRPLEPGAVPGLGPHHRAAVTGGRLLLREPGGRLRELLPPGALHDVSDPAVSFDGRRVAFAGVTHPDSAWRIFVVELDGSRLRAVTARDPALDTRHDDLDPCWIGDDRLCFASTRFPVTSQYAGGPATNLFVLAVPRDGAASGPVRVTSERNGADEPALDPRTGELVFARWWFNRFEPPGSGDGSVQERAPRDSVNLWHAIALSSQGPRLVCGDPRSRRATMAYQPTFLADGTPVGTFARNLGLSPRPGPLGIQMFPGRIGHAVRIAGAAIPDSSRQGYADALSLAAPAACAPAGLPDGRILFSFDPGGRGDFGLYVARAREGATPIALVDLPGTLELDAAPVVTRPRPRVAPQLAQASRPRPATIESLSAGGTFDYLAFEVFRAGIPSVGARIRFYAVPFTEAGGTRDTAILIREIPIGPEGLVDARALPADVPLFEQIVDREGRVLRSAHGPAHVAGFNAGLPGRESRCVGCHVGHSAERPSRRRQGP